MEEEVKEKNLETEENVEENEKVEEEKVEGTEKTEEEKVVKRPVHPKKKNNVVVIIVLILVIACIGGTVYFFGNGKSKDNNSNNDNKKSAEVKKQDYKSEYRLSGNGLENFDIAFLQLENEEKNKVYSPLSIKYALEMLAEGADGDTKAQLDAIIGDYVAKKYTNSNNMSFANAFFVRDTFKDSVKKDYVDLLKNKYNAEVIFDGFKDPTNINNWVSDKTFKLIPELVDDVSSNDFFLINALAIDMEWVKKIQAEHEEYNVELLHEEIKEGAYRPYAASSIFVDSLDSSDYASIDFEGFSKQAKSGEISAAANKYDAVTTLGENKIRETVGKEYKEFIDAGGCGDDDRYPKDVDKYLNGYIKDLNSNYKHVSSSTDFMFYDDSDVKVFAKDLKEYDGITLQYVGIMPKTGKLTSFIDDTNSSKINEYINNLKDISLNSFEDGYLTIIDGYIPMFKMDYELDLISDLQKMGVKDIFDSNKANLSKMTSEKEYIDPAIHKANIEFSNDGIKASAATAVGGKGAADCSFDYKYEVPTKVMDITFNRPYLYLVRDKSSGEVWFTGTVYEPIDYVSQPGY